MILDKVDKGHRRLVDAFNPAWLPVPGSDFALIGKPFRQRPGDPFFRLMRKVPVPGVDFPAGQDVNGIVQIVIPFGGIKRRGAILTVRMQRDNVAVIFGGEMDRAIGYLRPDAFSNFNQDMFFRRICNVIDGVEAQSIEAELLQPVQRHADHKLAHGGHIVGDAISPGVIRSGWKKSGERRGR